MSLSNLIQWCVGVIIAWSAIAHIDDIQRNILRAQAVLLYESRASKLGIAEVPVKPRSFT